MLMPPYSFAASSCSLYTSSSSRAAGVSLEREYQVLVPVHSYLQVQVVYY